MPKGVEHDWLNNFATYNPRVESLMPKGVEHFSIGNLLLACFCVESLMPKGVEHANLLESELRALYVSNL